MSKYTKRVPRPSQDSINSGRTYLKQSTMLEIFGKPGASPTVDCGPVSAKLSKNIVTSNVGPFNVTGHKQAMIALKAIFLKIKTENPELYATLGTAGMLCCRLVRGSKSNWSNHSWGFAVDITIEGVLDNMGDDLTLQGLLDLYRYFHEAGWFWGAGYSREDSMHFEPSDELMRDWHFKGLV